jgi:hypothetical protein
MLADGGSQKALAYPRFHSSVAVIPRKFEASVSSALWPRLRRTSVSLDAAAIGQPAIRL